MTHRNPGRAGEFRRLLARVVMIVFAVAIVTLIFMGERWLLVEAPPSAIELGITPFGPVAVPAILPSSLRAAKPRIPQ